MLHLEQIASYYPEVLKPFSRNLVVEYLQYKILEIIYDSDAGEKLWFMGGTAARIAYGNFRFSEDLDFDDRGPGARRAGRVGCEGRQAHGARRLCGRIA